MMEHLATALMYVSIPPAVLIVLVYGLTVKFEQSKIGVAFFLQSVGIAILLVLSGLFWALGADYSGRQPLRFITYMFMALGCWGLLYQLVSARLLHPARRKDDPVEEALVPDDTPE